MTAPDEASPEPGLRPEPKQPTSQTLLEQMRITESDISFRKNLLAFSPADADALLNCRMLIEDNIDDIVERFYEHQTSIPAIAAVIGDADTLERLRVAQRRYILDLFGGAYDLEYVNNRLRIGLVHKRIGVEPRLYLSAVNQLRDQLTRVLSEHLDGDAAVEASIEALTKLMYFDITLVFETYIRSVVSELEITRSKTEEYARALEATVSQRTSELRIDPLTGAQSRRYLFETLSRTLRAAQRRSEPVSLMFIDVNKFKRINDEMGHQYGDEVLSTVGRILCGVGRYEDSCFRYGGDEFCLILSNMDRDTALGTVGTRLQRNLSEAIPGITLSIGVAQTGPGSYSEPDELLRQADRAMYKMKGES
jgi:diguanylate cyclase (GGDEF)-like protein